MINGRTVIGEVSYETIGSSTSSLLLKSNGTVRVQWGSKLIDLIKNGKIVSDSSQEFVFLIENESEIKADGIYIINQEEDVQIWVCKDPIKYNLTESNLYIATHKLQNLTSKQKTQALINIGIQYNTLEEVKQAKLTEGIVYVSDTKTLYTISDGIIEEFSAKLKTVTEEKKETEGNLINDDVKIILSIAESEYLSLLDQTIIANYPIVLKDQSQLCSEGASDTFGFKLYMSGNKSYLDVDNINVRSGLPVEEYITITYNELYSLYSSNSLIPHRWYLISDFQNHWKLIKQNPNYNRPILIRALSTNSFYPEGELFDDRRIKIQYDITFNQKIIIQEEEVEGEEALIGEDVVEDESTEEQYNTISAKGKIIWMKDINNNEANFDFLDYYDSKNEPLTTLHPTLYTVSSIEKSIFPRLSYNNKLYVENLYGTVLDEDGNIDNTNTVKIDFQFIDFPPEPEEEQELEYELESELESEPNPEEGEGEGEGEQEEEETIDWNTIPSMIMHDNIITNCGNLILTNNCTNFSKNTINNINNAIIDNNITNSLFQNINNTENSTFNRAIINNVQFQSLTNCSFLEGALENIVCYSDISSYTFDSVQNPLLYDTSKTKEVYYSTEDGLTISIKSESAFFKGMIVMHSGMTNIPEGWAICDGNTYTYNDVSTTTPNLIDKFIKASSSTGEGEIIYDSNNTNPLKLNYYSLIFIMKL